MSASLQDIYRGCRVCVTGGAGFIGSHLCDALTALGAEVTVIDDLSTGARENLQQLAASVRLVEGSILDPAALREAMSGAAIIFHQAALTSVPASVEQPLAYHEVNATGTLRILEAARQAAAPPGTPGTPGTPRIVYAASSSVYGDCDDDTLTERVSPRPLSPYAVSKYTGELLLRTYALCYGISGVSLRYFNIFGPRQRPDSAYAAVIPQFARALLRGERPTVYGDGTQTRDFTHVANAVRANLLAGATTTPLAGEAVNIACGTKTSVLELLDKIAAALGAAPGHDLAPARIGDVLHSRADISAATRLLGYEPVTDLDAGLLDTMDYYRSLEAGHRHQAAP